MYFHAALIASVVVAAVAQLRWDSSGGRFLFGACALGVGIWSVKYFRRWKPTRLSAAIERNRVIWKSVLASEKVWNENASAPASEQAKS